jgi:hypothetical protein
MHSFMPQPCGPPPLQQFTLILLQQQLLCKAKQKFTGMPYSKGTPSLRNASLPRSYTRVIGKEKTDISSKLKDPTIQATARLTL